MPRRSPIAPLRLKPLLCGFASRPLPELCPDGQWRLSVNARQTDQGCARFPGWTKFASGLITTRDYNTEDLSDQLLSLQTYYSRLDEDVDDSSVMTWPDATYCGSTLNTRTQGRQPITFMTEVVSTVGTRTILRGTQSRLYELLLGKGTHRILRDGLGGLSDNPDIRLRSSQVGDFVLLTNNFDRPFSYVIGSDAHGCLMNATDEIPELADIGLTKALVTFQFRGILFLCNTEEDGARLGNMVRWSGADPTQWIEDPGFRLSGSFELDYGEEILAGDVIGDFAYLHTTRGTWQISVSSDATVVFNFQKIYSGPSGEGCIFYPFTFAATGGSHFYMAQDGVYEFSPSYPLPRRVEWIHQSSNVIYDNLNKSRCAAHIAGFDPITQELYFSCAQGSDSLPSVTLYCNTRYNQCSKLDFGATSFLSCTISNSQTWRDFLFDRCICTEADLSDSVKEGAGKERTNPPCSAYPDSIFTTETITIEDDAGDFEYEDYNQETASTGAFCNFLGVSTIAELCLACSGETVFTLAHAEDWTVKQIGGAFSRERFNPTTEAYTFEGYESRLVKILLFGSGEPKTMTRAALEFDVADEINPLSMKLRSGRSIRIQDPLSTRNACQIEWIEEENRLLKCIADDRVMEWQLFRRAEALYLDFSWTGKGGDVTFSSLEVDVMVDPKHV